MIYTKRKNKCRLDCRGKALRCLAMTSNIHATTSREGGNLFGMDSRLRGNNRENGRGNSNAPEKRIERKGDTNHKAYWNDRGDKNARKKGNDRFWTFKRIAFFLALVFYSGISLAQTTSSLPPTTTDVPDLATMINNISKTIPNFMALVTAIAYVLGIVFTIKGIIELKHFGESRTMMSREHGLSAPLVYLGVGAALFYLPSTIQVGIATFWDSSSPFAYVADPKDEWSSLVQSVFLIVQLLGVIAFIRGLVILSHVGGSHSQQGSMARALTHIIAGIFLINLYAFLQVVFNTFALGQI